MGIESLNPKITIYKVAGAENNFPAVVFVAARREGEFGP
jgi:hypothetical protein